MNKQSKIILSLIIIEAIAIYFLGPIPQDTAYHQFADQRALLGISNFSDVISNLPFFMVGLLGLIYVIPQYQKENLSLSWIFIFGGVLLVAPGSAYYHYSPDNWSLIWDRLPMTIGFTALLTELLSIFIHRKLEKFLLPLSLVFGILSVVYWGYTDDLRLYLFVQLTPILIIPTCLLIYDTKEIKAKYLWGAFLFYFLAKVLEYYDQAIFQLTNQIIGGHSLKHLAAASAVYQFYLLAKHQSADRQ